MNDQVRRCEAECGELDAALGQVFAREVRRTDIVLFREKLHWVKHSALPLPASGPVLR